jgi:hypothetical protein
MTSQPNRFLHNEVILFMKHKGVKQMKRRDLLSYLGCSALAVGLLAQDVQPCPDCGSLLHKAHKPQVEVSETPNQVHA